MSEWSSGYVSDIGYTYGYYNELNPLRARLAFLDAGLVCPDFGAACELGFGQGLSANIHAAASSTAWHGTDFNPAQAAFAQELARASGCSARLGDESFAEFTRRSDLPEFDFIGLHGIWSWISDENRGVIADFVRRKLKVGGVLYISYNTMPGWAAFAPMRHLLTEHAELIGVEGQGIVSRIDGALEFSKKLMSVDPAYARVNPLVAERLAKLSEQNRHYLAHEYFNRDWHPMHVATVAQWLGPAKVSFACSAHYLDHVNAVNLTPQQQAFLAEIPDAMFRESVRDFLVNQQFRRDYWVKGPRRLSALEQAEALRRQKVVLTTPRSEVSLKVTGALGEATMTEAVYGPVLDVLADLKPRTLGELERDTRALGITFAQVWQAALVLCGANRLALVQDDAVSGKARRHTEALNAHILDKARGSGEIGFLASPLTGGGIPVGRFEQLFLLSLRQGATQPQAWARFAWDVLAPQGRTLVKDGKPVERPEDNLAVLTELAIGFAGNQLPVLKALQIA